MKISISHAFGKKAIAVAVCAMAIAASPVGAQSSMAKSAGHGSEQMSQSMMSGMEDMKKMKTTGDVDKDFAMMMKMHHQQALEMAKLEIEQGKDPAMKKMAQSIMAAQKKEIEQFDKWMQKPK